MTTPSTEVDKPQSSVPALANTPALEIGAEDVALPRLYLGQYMSKHVQNGEVEFGQIFTALGEDDPDPQILWSPGDEPGITAHILALRKGKSITQDGELILFEYNDQDAPPDAWVTYNYVVALPEIDPEIPYKWLLTKTAQPTAKQMNLVLAKNAQRGPAHEIAFEVTTAPRENKKGKYVVPRARHIEADSENVAKAERLAVMVSGQADEVRATNDEPDI